MSERSAVTRDGFLDNRLIIDQPAAGAHRAGLDAVLLAAALEGDAEGTVVDLGAGVGVAGLAALARLEALRAILVEVDPTAAALARGNIILNGFEGRARVIETDALAPGRRREADGLMPHVADHLIMNPPFHPSDRGRQSPNPDVRRAHAVDPGDLDAWLRVAAALTRPQGTLTVIFRADELVRLLAAIGSRFGSLAVLPIHPRAGAPAHRILVRGRPQGRAPLRLLPGLVLHEDDGAWRPEIDRILRGAPLAVPWWG